MASAKIYLDTRRAKLDNTYPVKIRITNNRKASYFLTKYSFTEAEFKKIISGFRLSDAQKDIQTALNAFELKANQILDDLQVFNLATFKTRFTSKGDRSDLIFLLQSKAQELKESDNHANSNLYNQSAKLLTKYIKEVFSQDILPLSTIDKKWLQSFEKWSIKKDYSVTTIGMYLIRVRAIFNNSIALGELKSSYYPFNKPSNQGGYVIPQAVNNKRPLNIEEIMKIYNYKSIDEQELFVKDIFLFSYLANGMNTYDIWRLKWSDIEGNIFSFTRKKTENKPKGKNKIDVAITDELRDIINRHGSRKISNDYIFNVITPSMNALQEMNAVKAMTTILNTSLKKIAAKLEITSKISFYYARHSYSNILMNNEAPLAFISKQLGHSSISTTENYLSNFSDTNAAKYQSNLLDKKIV